MEENKTQTPPVDLDTASLNEIILECGIIKMPVNEIIDIFSIRLSPEELAQLKCGLQDPGSEYGRIYHSGLARGKFNRRQGLNKAAVLGFIDSYSAFSQEEKKQLINDLIQKNFGITP